MRRLLSGASLLIVALIPLSAAAQTIDDLRQEFRSLIAAEYDSIGSGYGQMLSLFLDRSVSFSRLDIEGDQDQGEFDILKLPLRWNLPLGDGPFELALRGTLSHSSYQQLIELDDENGVDTKWNAESAQFGAGLRYTLSDHWTASAIAEAGISQLENEADYSGALGPLLDAVLQGILFDWDTNVAVYSLRTGFDYDNLPQRDRGLTVSARYTYSYIDSFSESDELLPFHANTNTLTLRGEYRHPWGFGLADFPLFGIVGAGATAFVGDGRDALGFDHFFQAGYAVALDISERDYWVKSLSIGYQFNKGSDVEGHSILFNWEIR